MGQFASSMIAPQVSSYRTVHVFYRHKVTSMQAAHKVYKIDFSLARVPVVRNFVDRPVEMKSLRDTLLPQQGSRRKVFVLHGLGGIGKTQLSVEFARQFRHSFSSVFWLDGDTEDKLMRSIAACIGRIPARQISEPHKINRGDSDIQRAVRDFKGWLSKTNNTDWLVIVDNLDKEYRPNSIQDFITDFISEADHGSILFTTRLSILSQLGSSYGLGKMDNRQAQELFKSWSQFEYGIPNSRLKCTCSSMLILRFQTHFNVMNSSPGFRVFRLQSLKLVLSSKRAK